MVKSRREKIENPKNKKPIKKKGKKSGRKKRERRVAKNKYAGVGLGEKEMSKRVGGYRINEDEFEGNETHGYNKSENNKWIINFKEIGFWNCLKSAIGFNNDEIELQAEQLHEAVRFCKLSEKSRLF